MNDHRHGSHDPGRKNRDDKGLLALLYIPNTLAERMGIQDTDRTGEHDLTDHHRIDVPFEDYQHQKQGQRMDQQRDPCILDRRHHIVQSLKNRVRHRRKAEKYNGHRP